MPATAPPPATEPLCRMTGIAAFRAGEQNGEPYTVRDLSDLAANYARYAADDYYVPFVSLNHDDGLSFGDITGARVEPVESEPTLVLDADGVPVRVRDWAASGRLRHPSIEFWEPGQVNGPDGRPNRTRVLKCLTLLGNSPPGVKGLPRLSSAKMFSDRGKTRKFSGVRLMDRQEMLDALKAAGFPVGTIPDVVPDETVKAILDFVQKANANPAPPSPPPPPGDGAQAFDDGCDPNDPTKKPGNPAVTMSHTVKFTDRFGRQRTGTLQQMADEQAATFAALRNNAAAIERDQLKRLDAAKRAKVKAFRDEMTGGGGRKAAFMTPAQFDAQEAILLALDDTNLKKFADGKATGTALDESIDGLRKAFTTPVRKFGDNAADPQRGRGGIPDVRADVVQATLRGSADGLAVLAGQTK